MDPRVRLDGWKEPLADPWDMDSHQWLSRARSRLEGVLQGMPESYRKARIKEAHRQLLLVRQEPSLASRGQ